MPGHGSYPGYTTGSQPSSGGGAMGKILAVGVVGLFILAGAGGGLAWWAMQAEDDPADTNDPIAQPQPNPNGLGTGQPLQPIDPNNPPMVPTSPMQPMQPGQPAVAPTPTPTPTPTTQPEPTPTPEPVAEPTPRRPRGPSPADEARARGLVANGLGAARRNDFSGAVAALSQAQRAVGRRSPITRELEGELTQRGSNQVGILLQQGRCGQAQALYRQLRSVGAAGNARGQFGDWCPAQ
jgi:type IV secretory pathway VirB10-like protein